MTLPFVDFILHNGRLVTATEHPDSEWNFIIGVREGRIYLARFLLYVMAPFIGFSRRAHIFLIPSNQADQGNTNYIPPAIAGIMSFLGNWCEMVAVWFQKKRVFRMREGFGIGQDSYLSVWDNGVELQFYFYSKEQTSIITQGIDITTEPHTIGNIMSTIQPLSDRVFLEAMEEDRTTKSGIVLPDSAEKERPVKGRVVAVGAGKLNDRGERNPMSVKVGDAVLFKKYGPDEIELEGKKYLVAEESDILAILQS